MTSPSQPVADEAVSASQGGSMGVKRTRICQHSSSRIVCEKPAKFVVDEAVPVCSDHLQAQVRDLLLWQRSVTVESA